MYIFQLELDSAKWGEKLDSLELKCLCLNVLWLEKIIEIMIDPFNCNT